MHTKRYLLITLSAFLLVFAISCSTNTTSKPYEYPVVPGTDEWVELSSLEEKIQVCQVPVGDLKAMDTDAVVETVLRYPLLGNFMAYNSYVQGFHDVFSYANCCQELLKREDRAEKLLSAYKATRMPVLSDFKDMDEYYEAVWRVDYMEGLLALSEFHDQLSKSEVEELAALVTENRKVMASDGLPSSYYDSIRREEITGSMWE